MLIGVDNLLDKVEEDLALYDGKRELVKAGFLERHFVKSAPPSKLHVNPEDEFCDPNIGPNNEILQKYSSGIRKNGYLGQPPFEEPIEVAKMKPEGYMILNGHHRWLAAVKKNLKKVPIEIVNPKDK